jgi:hypothetical protein
MNETMQNRNPYQTSNIKDTTFLKSLKKPFLSNLMVAARVLGSCRTERWHSLCMRLDELEVATSGVNTGFMAHGLHPLVHVKW